MSDLAKRLADLSPEKRELLLQRLKQKTENVPQTQIKPLSRASDSFPLSFAQQRLWFLDQLDPGNSAYNIYEAVRLTGLLDIAALSESLNEIVKRHEALRTTFAALDGQPVQVIAPVLTLPLPQVDLSELPETEREAEAWRLAAEEAQLPFDLAQGPLVRTTLLRLHEEDWLLVLTMHHIVSDWLSLQVFFRELAALYTAFFQGQPSPLFDLTIQYADFAVWQRQWLQGEVLEAQLAYWKQQLDDAPSVLELPTDRPRPAVQTFRGAHQSLVLSQSLTKALKELNQREEVTLFMTMLAAFAILLHHYTGQKDIVVGSPIAGRNRVEIEGLIGFFVNTLVLRTDLSGKPSFRELLRRVREVALSAYSHQDLPFELLVQALQLERSLSHTPLFQVMFNLLTSTSSQIKLPNLTAEILSPPQPGSKFDLTLYVRESNERIQLVLAYNIALFEGATITRLLEQFQTLVENIVANPDRCFSSLPLLTETERHQRSLRNNLLQPKNLFIEFKKANIEQSIPERFEQQVDNYPTHIAVKSKNYEWSYEELNFKANWVAQTILALCNNKEEKIALLFEHDAPMIASLLGVLKSGNTYVPLDPFYPKERLAYVLKDSQAAAILTNNINLALAKELTEQTLQIINIDDIESGVFVKNINLSISPDTLAYILYTSGSTGQPKGVMQNHRNVLHFIKNYTNNLHISASDRLTLLSSYSFDAAVMDIFSALLNGASLYPMNIKEEGLASLSKWLIEQEITIYHSTPTVYRDFVINLTGEEEVHSIRLVVLGGEEVYKRDVELYKKHFSSECIFVNGLGPTESTVTLQYFINKHTQITRNAVPVGYPVEDTEVLLLNEAGEQAQVYGEIAIASPHTALGYWQKPEVTRAAFLPDPEGKNRRLYRTGDLGRLLPDGSIEFIGRKDFQVKIRGYRIEVSEIETLLLEMAQIKEAIVIAREDIPGNKRIVAYIVPHQREAPTRSEVCSFLKQKLPDYMVPSAFVFLEALPLTPNSKVDRRMLPAPDQARPELEETFVAPQDTLELQLTKIWEQTLGIQPIGVRNNFFELGGHSLLAVRLFAQIEKTFGKYLPLATLFQAPTVEQLSSILRQKEFSAPWLSLVTIQSGGSQPPLFCIHGGGFNVLIYRDLANNLGPEQPVYGLQPQGLDGKEAPHTRIEDMAADYIRQMRIVQPEGPYFLAGLSYGGKIALEMAQQLYMQGQQVALLAMFDTYGPDGLKLLPPLPRLLSVLLYALRYTLPRFMGKLIRREPSAILTQVLEKVKLFKRMSNEQTSKETGQLAVGPTNHSSWHSSNSSYFERWVDDLSMFILKFSPWAFLAPNAEMQNVGGSLAHALQKMEQARSIAQKAYTLKVYPGRITLFLASERPPGFYTDPQLGWGGIAAGGLEIYKVPGHHSILVQSPVLAEKLGACLESSANSVRPPALN